MKRAVLAAAVLIAAINGVSILATIAAAWLGFHVPYINILAVVTSGVAALFAILVYRGES